MKTQSQANAIPSLDEITQLEALIALVPRERRAEVLDELRQFVASLNDH
ncbi:hypothetical protein [Paraburkholderia strydomiana]|jgi:hypothetical protein|uniref:Uncharacterized protein n=1 Tax=Paraburkholderia strydomiana TaxID=1245417 RepID=A0ABW9CCI4_9BURK